MHAYLLYSPQNNTNLDKKIEEISKQEGASLFEYPLKSIEDAKEIKKITKTSTRKKRIILLRNIEKSSLESLNALLKTIEEPPPNTIFLLTTNNLNAVLPTIKSRCRLINIQHKPVISKEKEKEIENFINSKIGKRLLIVNNINKREEALEFLENLIIYINTKKGSQSKLSKFLETVQNAYTAIKANGNIKLQLTKMVINT